jgi:hypothetical protein
MSTSSRFPSDTQRTMELRAVWTDEISLDKDLPPLTKVAAIHIGRLFNHLSGDTTVREANLADMMGVSVRTAKRSLRELERCGWLLPRRRERLRDSDGCDRGFVNTYALAVARHRLVDVL